MSGSLTATATTAAERTNPSAAQAVRGAAGAAPAGRSFDELFAPEAPLDEAPPDVVETDEPADAAQTADAAEAEADDDAEEPTPAAGDAAPDADEAFSEPSDPLRIIGGLTGQKAAKLTAAAIEVELTRAAEVDLAALHAAELARAAPKSELATPKDATRSRPVDSAARDAAGAPFPARAAPRGIASEQSSTSTPPPADAAAHAASRAAPSAPAATASLSTAVPAPVPVPTASLPTNAGTQSSPGVSGVGVSAAVGIAAAPSGAVTAPSAGGWTQRLLAIQPGSASKSAAPAARPATPESLAQVQRGLAQLLRQEGGELTLRLNPRSLGEVRVQLGVREGVVDATIRAETREARVLLEDAIDTLRSSLEGRGLRVERLVIDGPDRTDVRGEWRGGAPGSSGTQPEAAFDGGHGDGLPDGGRRGQHHAAGSGGEWSEDPAERDDGSPLTRSVAAERSAGAWARLGIDTLA
jgi:flagellar hook-length control protein FliK